MIRSIEDWKKRFSDESGDALGMRVLGALTGWKRSPAWVEHDASQVSNALEAYAGMSAELVVMEAEKEMATKLAGILGVAAETQDGTGIDVVNSDEGWIVVDMVGGAKYKMLVRKIEE